MSILTSEEKARYIRTNRDRVVNYVIARNEQDAVEGVINLREQAALKLILIGEQLTDDDLSGGVTVSRLEHIVQYSSLTSAQVETEILDSIIEELKEKRDELAIEIEYFDEDDNPESEIKLKAHLSEIKLQLKMAKNERKPLRKIAKIQEIKSELELDALIYDEPDNHELKVQDVDPEEAKEGVELRASGSPLPEMDQVRPKSEPNPTTIRCPKCGSAQVVASKQGFGFVKGLTLGVAGAVTGGIALGAAGLATGNIGKNKIDLTCTSCGKQWRAGS